MRSARVTVRILHRRDVRACGSYLADKWMPCREVITQDAIRSPSGANFLPEVLMVPRLAAVFAIAPEGRFLVKERGARC